MTDDTHSVYQCVVDTNNTTEAVETAKAQARAHGYTIRTVSKVWKDPALPAKWWVRLAVKKENPT